MAEAKIEIKVGEVSFVGEGTEAWLTSQLESVIRHLPDLIKVAPPLPSSGDRHGGAHEHAQKPGRASGTLAAFLGTNNRKKSQTRKFLATAVWLGKERLSTRDVSDALSQNKQGKLTNAAQCLNDNVGQGYCEKDGGQFYVTEEGRTEIG